MNFLANFFTYHKFKCGSRESLWSKRRSSKLLKDEFILILYFPLLRKLKNSLTDSSNPMPSAPRPINHVVGNQMLQISLQIKQYISPLRQDSASIFQTLILMHVNSCILFCSSLGVLILYCQHFCKFHLKDNVQVFQI